MRTIARQTVTALEDPRAAIVAIDSNGSVTKVNRQARKFLGESGHGLEGPNLGALVADFFSSHHRGGLARLSFSMGDDEDSELTVVLSERPRDEERPGATVTPWPAHPSVDEYGDRHKVADYIAHELKNPLGTILGLTRLLRFRTKGVEDITRAEALETIEAEAEKSLQIVEAILRLVQGRDRARMSLSEVPIHAVLRRVVSDHRRRNPDRTVILSGDSLTYAWADSLGVELAIGNLLTNAEKYSPREKEIEVAVHQEGNRVTIMVLNGGSSLPPEQYERLWDIYTTGIGPEVIVGGSGIGLALCKEIVEMMGGRVWAGPNRAGGSVFAVTLTSPS